MKRTTIASRRAWSQAPILTLTGTIILAANACAAAFSRGDDAARFDSPEAAVKALIEAAKSTEKGALSKVFGSVAAELLSGDDVQDRADVEKFAKRLNSAHKLVKNEDGTMTLKVGKTGHPFAIPLAQKNGKWFFDTAAGKEEILNRRIGDNELRTIAVCRGYVVAQREYAAVDRDGDDVLEYAQRGRSTPGKKDGLYWESAEGEDPSPLGPLVAEASAEGYGKKESASESKSRPYHGYVYKLLTKQGDKAPGGKFDYIINGNMVAGFALLAYPVDWQSSGVMTFQVNTNGKVFQKDLGEKTAELAGGMEAYDVDSSWSLVTD
jgi:hypothetical protein